MRQESLWIRRRRRDHVLAFTLTLGAIWAASLALLFALPDDSIGQIAAAAIATVLGAGLFIGIGLLIGDKRWRRR